MGGEDRGGVERGNEKMSVQQEKEGKVEEKGGHIVDSRPGLLSVQLADKFLFVSLSPSFLIPLFSKHVPT